MSDEQTGNTFLAAPTGEPPLCATIAVHFTAAVEEIATLCFDGELMSVAEAAERLLTEAGASGLAGAEAVKWIEDRLAQLRLDILHRVKPYHDAMAGEMLGLAAVARQLEMDGEGVR